MPRIRQLTPELRAEQQKRDHAKRSKGIITAAARCAGMSLTDLSRATCINYDTLLRHMDSGRLDLHEIGRIGSALSFDSQTYAAVCNAKEPCRYERWRS